MPEQQQHQRNLTYPIPHLKQHRQDREDHDESEVVLFAIGELTEGRRGPKGGSVEEQPKQVNEDAEPRESNTGPDVVLVEVVEEKDGDDTADHQQLR